MNIFKNNTLFKGKIQFKFEKLPYYENHFEKNEKFYISTLDDILINFFNKFYLTKRIISNGYDYDENKLELIKRQGYFIKTKIEIIDKNFKTIDSKIINGFTKEVDIEKSDNKLYLTYYTTNKDNIKIGDLFYSWDLVQGDVIDLDVASKKDTICNIGFFRCKNKYVALLNNDSALYGIGDKNLKGETISNLKDAKKATIEYIKTIKNKNKNNG